ncbi:antitoxin [Moraxella sp. ZJ142]|uniref:antitoxin n=1 Tax=Moraxella marmotae TaxID=3344520 RepID=UPI0035D3E538
MPTIHTKPFMAGNSQAVRLPKEFAYPADTPLILNKENGVITIRPVTSLADVPSIFHALGDKMTGDFERMELDDTERDW